MNRKQIEILCSSCGRDTLLTRTPKYDGFVKVGELLKCASCGFEYASESEVPFKNVQSLPKIFQESDYSRKPDVFCNDEKGRMCLHCSHYVVNPFSQRCGLTFKSVEATDSCNDFKRKQDKEEQDAEG